MANKDKAIYVVREEMEGGYMPDSVSYFISKRAAQSYMADVASSARDDGYTVTGSAKSGLYQMNDGRALDNLIILDETTAGDLGYTDGDLRRFIEELNMS